MVHSAGTEKSIHIHKVCRLRIIWIGFFYCRNIGALSIPVSLVTGSIVALFLWLLDKAINFRFAHPWLLFFLSVGAILDYVLYDKFGKNSDRGNNLIMDEIHQPGGGVPARMAPLVLLTTIITHFFGGSAGRE